MLKKLEPVPQNDLTIKRHCPQPTHLVLGHESDGGLMAFSSNNFVDVSLVGTRNVDDLK